MAEIDFVGMDPNSPKNECAAVFVDREVGGAYYQGRLVTDPEVLALIAKNSPIAPDEAVVYQPPSMAPIVMEALNGDYEQGREGPGVPAFERMVHNAQRSVVHLEMRDTYDTTDAAFIRWKEDSNTDYEWDDWIELVGSAVARGVRFRRLRIVSEPVTDYIRWEHAISDGNIRAGEELRWLPRRQAFDLMLPGADFFMFDQRIVRYNFNAGDGHSLRQYEHVSDPRMVAQVVAAFEMAWERAIPHEDYHP